METGMTDKRQGRHTEHLRTKIAAGYILIFLLVGGIVHLWVDEWRKLETFETENHRINALRMEVHDVYVRVVELSLLGETVLEWEVADVEEYRDKRQAVDSLLCRFKNIYPAERIDSVRRLLEDKEKQLCGIMRVLDEQEDINERIAERVPVIAWKSTQEEPKKTKRKGLFGIFGKREKPEPTATTTMLYTLNRDMITQQKAQSRRLSDHADSLAARNAELNHQLQTLIKQMDKKVQTDLLRREAEITFMRERSFMQIGGLTGFILLLLIMSYIIIHRYARRISRYRRETTSLIAQLSESNSMNGKLTATRQKTMYTITHELRTPLTAIHGYAELIRKSGTAEIQHHAGSVLQASKRMIAMLNSLLSFFRLENGKERMNISPFRLQSITDVLEAEFRPMAESKDLKLIVENSTDVILMGDKERIMQIGDNLLSNAIKYTQAGSVSFHSGYDGKTLALIVEDTGSGMSEEEQQRVFGEFERLSNAATQDGFGLGLAIVRSLAELMDGSITVESVPGKGSRFTVTLPLEKSTETERQPSSYTVTHHLSGCSVLSMDNDQMILGMLHDMFEQSGVHNETCMDMGGLTEKLRGSRYDLLTTDLKMPDISGYEVLELLRSSDIGNSRTIPVLAITGSGSVTEEELKQAGFSAVLFKPFSIDELLAVAEQCIGENRTRYIDLTPLFAYGNKRHRLECLISETEKEMAGIRKAIDNADKDKIDGWIHHIRSSWMLIRAEQPLQELYEAIHENRTMEEIQARAGNVLLQGEKIIRLAKKEIEKTKWEK